jgi:hypothetical protein
MPGIAAWSGRRVAIRRLSAGATLWLCLSDTLASQTHALLQGRVVDASGGAVQRAVVRVVEAAAAFDISVATDGEGRYAVPAVPPGTYTVTVNAAGFRPASVEALNVEVGRTVVCDFRLAIGTRTESVVVRPAAPLVERGTAAVGHVVTTETIQRVPLNGRHFVDLGLLGPASVAPSQTGFSARPIRGVGALAINTAGNREEAVGFLVNGVSTNNLTFGSLIFEPPLASVREFKVENSAFGPEHGHVSGGLVNIVTRSGSEELRGEGFVFVRNQALDARNFFEFTSSDPHPFERHQFGASLGGPIPLVPRSFFHAAYEGFRQRQGLDMNSLVPSDEQRASVTDPAIRQLIVLIPRANFFDSAGTPRFVGSAPALVDTDRWTADLQHAIGASDRVHLFYGAQRVRAIEPASQGNSIPGFGHASRPFTSALTLDHTRRFGRYVNEARFARSRLRGGTFPAAPLNPAELGIGTGVTGPLGLPQMIVAGDLNFGGPGTLPQGRYDTSYVVSDTFTAAAGRHTLRMGGEYRHFINDNFAEGTGALNFPTMEAFLAGAANAFSITLGQRRSVIDQRAVAAFVQDSFTLSPAVTFEAGVRYEWHVTPTERSNRFVVFDADRASLVRVGVDVADIYRQNNQNVEPRFGVAWSLSPEGRTVLRAAYAVAVDQPGTTAVRDTAANPPFAAPLTAAGSIPIGGAIDIARPLGLAPATIDPRFTNASLRSWNVNLQRQIAAHAAVTVGYLGSRGKDLRLTRNINQPLAGVRPYPAVAASSPILPGAPLVNIMQVESSGFSTYHAGWVSLTQRQFQRLQLDASYTWSKSLDTNSLNSSGFAVQDAYDIASQHGLSDFDARHRIVLSAVYTLPSTGSALTRGWQLAVVVQSQSGNPVNIVTSTGALNGVPNTVRPDVTGPIRIVGAVDRWFDPSVFVAVDRFGNLGRNVVIGPAFHNTDISVARHLRAGPRLTMQLQMDVFDLFNHPNFGPPGNVVGSPTFGRITRTRLPTGEAGSSRQIQLAAKLLF